MTKHRTIDTPQGQVKLVLPGDLDDASMQALFALMLTMPELFMRLDSGEIVAAGLDISYTRRIELIARQLSIFHFFFCEYAFVGQEDIKVWIQLTNAERHAVIVEYMRYHNYSIYQDATMDAFNKELGSL
jgi:hypothetical protein